jgi:hypothetical protein
MFAETYGPYLDFMMFILQSTGMLVAIFGLLWFLVRIIRNMIRDD